MLRWHHSRVSNGILEPLNSHVQAAKRRARGYRTTKNLVAMAYLVAGKLNLQPTHTNSRGAPRGTPTPIRDVCPLERPVDEPPAVGRDRSGASRSRATGAGRGGGRAQL